MRAWFVLLFLVSHLVTHAQKFSTESGLISFFSDAPVEDISAVNTEVGSLFDSATGELVFVVPVKDFQFEKRLMREHFNEKYMETNKFPKASFKGKVTGFQGTKQGVQEVKVEGKLSIHGITRDISVRGTMETSGGKLTAKSKFMVKLADYGITIPQIVWQNIAEDVEVKVEFIYKTL